MYPVCYKSCSPSSSPIISSASNPKNTCSYPPSVKKILGSRQLFLLFLLNNRGPMALIPQVGSVLVRWRWYIHQTLNSRISRKRCMNIRSTARIMWQTKSQFMDFSFFPWLACEMRCSSWILALQMRLFNNIDFPRMQWGAEQDAENNLSCP